MSIVKVAEKAGVSPGTVSRVINNRPGVSAEVIEKVRGVMDDLGYVPRSIDKRPGPKAKGIAQPVSRTVAFVALMERSQFNSPVFSRVVQGVETKLSELGQSMILTVQPDVESRPDFMKNGPVDGVLLFGGRAEKLERAGDMLGDIPTVSLFSQPSSFSDLVTVDNIRVGTLAAEYLLAKGHKNTAYIGPKSVDDDFSYRRIQFRDIIENAGGMVHEYSADDSDLFIVSDKENMVDEHKLRSLMEKYCGERKPATGLFVGSDIFVSSVYLQLYEMGKRAGEDFEVVSVNNERPYLQACVPQPATIDIKGYEVGQCAVERLLWRIENPDMPIMSLMLEPELVV